MGMLDVVLRYKYALVFKTFAILAILFFSATYEQNFSICNEVQDISCMGNATVASDEKAIPFETRCRSADSKNCCDYVYEDEPQCYMYSLRQSIFAGYTGGALMLFAEAFYIIALLVYAIFPFLTKYVVYDGGYMSGPYEAAKVTTEVFAKAIYFITPVLLVLILFTIYRNLPVFL